MANDSDATMDTGTCFSYEMVTTNGIWGAALLRNFSLPVFIMTSGLVVIVTHAVAFGLRPFRQPRALAEILAGILLGPTFLPKYLPGGAVLAPLYVSAWLANIVQTVGHLGLFLFIFLVGVDTDLASVRRVASRAATAAASGYVLTFAVTVSAAFLIRDNIYADMINPEKDSEKDARLYFLVFILTATSLPVVTRIVAELKLLGTDFGRTVLVAAVLTDTVSWGLFPVAIDGMGLGVPKMDPSLASSAFPDPVKVALSMAVLAALCFCCARPMVWWIQRRTPEGEAVSNTYISPVLAAAMLAGFLSDGIGIHYAFGGFAFGLAVPAGPVANALVDRMEEFVTTLMMPLFFAGCGLRTDFSYIFRPMEEGYIGGPMYEPTYSAPKAGVMVLVLLASGAKVASTLVAGLYHGMTMNEGLSFGLLMSCRSLVENVMLDIGHNKLVLTHAAFGVLVLENLILTLMVTPLVTELYRPAKIRPLIGYKRRNLQRSKLDVELRMVVCVHNARNVPAMLSLLEISNPTKRSPIHVFALHLVELTGRASAALIVHKTGPGNRGSSSAKGPSDHIISAFESYEQHAGGVTVGPLTAVADYVSMPDDICAAAADRRVSIIVLPFHKQLAVDGYMEDIHPAIRGLNQQVLNGSPCSVGILVDRGIGGTARYAGGRHHHVAVLFFGGADDREALAYAWRMAEHPGITVSVVRFLPGDDVASSVPPSPAMDEGESRVINVAGYDSEREMKMDEECMAEFRVRYASYDSVVYSEKVVSCSEDTVAAIRSLESVHDLYVVGRRNGVECPLTAGLTEWSEHPELGVIGDLLASSDFGATVSVLVLQQYVGEVAPESPGRHVKQYVTTNANPKGKRSGFGPGWQEAS